MSRTFGIGLLGCGTVGQGLVDLLDANGSAIADRLGFRLEIRRIGIRDVAKPRRADPSLLTDDLDSVVLDPAVHLVAEAMGGLEPAGDRLRAALKSGKPVATANKLLMANEGPSLLADAISGGADLRWEAAVCAGIPIVAALDCALAANRVRKIAGVVNGTTNFMLERMAEPGGSYEAALADAQTLGYAEADPSSDVDGWDAAYKISILGSMASGEWVDPGRVLRAGIRGLDRDDALAAAAIGGRIRLIAEYLADGQSSTRVEPCVVLPSSPFFDLPSSQNLVVVDAEPVGRLEFRGPGAGAGPTASALAGDLAAMALDLARGDRRTPRPWRTSAPASRRRPDGRWAVVWTGEWAKSEAWVRRLGPVRVEKRATAADSIVFITEPVEFAMIEDALDRSGRDGVRCVWRVEG